MKTKKIQLDIVRIATLFMMLVPAASAADYFRLQPGNTWVYRSGQFGDTFTMQVAATPLWQNSHEYYRVSGYATEPLWMRTDESGSLLYLDPDTDEERILTLLEPTDRMWFHAPKRPCEQEGQAQLKTAPYEGSAGRYPSALPVKYRSFGCGDIGVEQEKFVENIGMVQRTVQSIAGPVTYDLVYANLGAVAITEVPNTSFGVSLRKSGNAKMIADLRLRTAGGAGVRLTFPSLQSYDVILRDEAGNELWRWSDGWFFSPIVYTREVHDLAFQAEIPLNPQGRWLPPGTYTVEAWLTTVSQQRQFAASTSFRIDPAPDQDWK